MVGQTVKRGLPFPSTEAARAMVELSDTYRVPEGPWWGEGGEISEGGERYFLQSKHPFLHDMISKRTLCPAMNLTYDIMFNDYITLISRW